VVLHIGEPKTGTTFLQQVMWRNRSELAAQSVVLPGHHPQDHYRASQDLRGIQKLTSDPAGSWTGEWEILAREAVAAVAASKVAVISHELFAAAEPQQADHAVQSLQPAEVHIVLTVRDMASLLPAEWQESVKHRNARAWEDWLDDVIDRESRDEDRRQWWFWRVHDTMAILDLWSRRLPAAQVHVITIPAPGTPPQELWRRFAGVLGIAADGVDITRARSNTSLGLAETEFLRRLNQALPEEVPDWFYMWNVKEPVAHQALAARPQGSRLLLPASREAWAKEEADTLVHALNSSGYDLIGTLDELAPHTVSQAYSSPSDQPAGRVLDAAVDAAAAMIVSQYRKAYPAARPQPHAADGRGLVSRVESTVASSPRLKRAVRDLSSRSRTMRKLRIAVWRAAEGRRNRTRS
jgi:hypothetical protein